MTQPLTKRPKEQGSLHLTSERANVFMHVIKYALIHIWFTFCFPGIHPRIFLLALLFLS